MQVDGIGLARMEFMISNHIKIHSMALVHPEIVSSEDQVRKIRKLTMSYANYAKFLVECGIDSISVVPDSLISLIQKVAEAEKADTQMLITESKA